MSEPTTSPYPHNVCADIVELQDRQPAIRQMLQPLLKTPEDVWVRSHQIGRDGLVWAAVQRNSSAEGDYTEWLFRTNLPDLYANYYERWQRFISNGQDKWYLERTYIHFHLLDRSTRTRREVLLLHCDPNENREHAEYKQSPHLHILTAPEPWPHAHLALNVGYLPLMLKDASSLTLNLQKVIAMLKDQVLSPLTES